jgi:hypothetical protein
MPIIPSTGDVELGRSWSEANPGKNN